MGVWMKLQLGIIDLPYANAPRAPGSKATSGTQTTGDVAQWLENKYHIYASFWTLHGDEIAKDVERSLEGALNSMLNGAPMNHDVFGSASSKIRARFSEFLMKQEMDGLFPGVPTAAALRGVNHRMKHPYKRRAPRPSFIDTGLFESSFKAWMEK